jgi:hypothetical protein
MREGGVALIRAPGAGPAAASWLAVLSPGFFEDIFSVLPPFGSGRARARMKLPFLNCLCAALVMVVALDAAASNAQSFDVPQGFVASPEGEQSARNEWRPVLTVRPAEGSFSELSSISLREVVGPVGDPDAWLRARLSGDTPDEAAAEELFASPDSPFGDPASPLREAIPKLFAGVKELSRLPLSFCEGPNAAYNASGLLRELYCVYQVGPFRQYLILRLQQVGGRWYYTEVRAMNERQFRQLLAIANSSRAMISGIMVLFGSSVTNQRLAIARCRHFRTYHLKSARLFCP